MKKEILILDPTNNYTHQLIPKFTPIAKKARLIPEREAKMIITDGITSQKKDLLINMLYNRKAIPA